ncbi:arsenosugar biosynthesis radical SAM protein ArsS [Rubrivirga sp. S365]|uniref:Arsenosugar biosynthesis radical SAM protein ArsS n=1 Tax=Rubrivirga litoralis TaxID=3075598 RepID=A0ABU3BR13_9BACT|nr:MULTISPECIES: arsenosugar biosynthesis radical SAM (seleno)protein ArsS [unclassified Rubrivirga]MDT0631729.1 arsenosugar biosynthesis radical SAM protein ArsS [Rubrivirga sp. F394]MDT7856107.1 arsenosugar biosynthesis radical SAM protein ArsS [Rubrivirga sp. S365]
MSFDATGDGSAQPISLPVLSAELVADVQDGPKRTTSLYGRRTPLAEPDVQLAALDAVPLALGPTGTGSFHADLAASGWPGGLRPAPLEIVQVNVGKLCNMTCRHCHVDSGPDRTTENMDREAVDACLGAIDRILAHPDCALHTVDLTGGAPELNPHFEYLVDECVARGLHVIDRCNLTILTVRRYRHLPEWFAERGVEVACSLPHYRELGTDAQRGEGTYAKSLKALRALNDAGYGQSDPERVLTLVTNPVGSFLAGNQASLEDEWKAALARNHGVSFDRLLALNNMPMSRYLEWLIEKGQLETYMERLLGAFNPGAIDGVMCRNTVSVGWDGRVYDCDFNQQLEMDAAVPFEHVADFDLDAWQARAVRTARHCYGCTAGAGSSCGGATA